MSAHKFLEYIHNNEVRFINFCFTDLFGAEKRISLSSSFITEKLCNDGLEIRNLLLDCNLDQKYRLLLKPDLSYWYDDIYASYRTTNLICDIIDQDTGQEYENSPRSILKKAINTVKGLCAASDVQLSSDLEFHVFDSIQYDTNNLHSFYVLKSQEASEANSADCDNETNMHGYRCRDNHGCAAQSPTDSLGDLRAEIVLNLKKVSIIKPAMHYHGPASAQCKITLQANEALSFVDSIQISKTIVKNTVFAYGKTCTFMPKPLMNARGNGMSCRISLLSDGNNMFSVSGSGISDISLHFIAGITKNLHPISAITNPTFNSFKRLLSEFGRPCFVTYSQNDESSAIVISPGNLHHNNAYVEYRIPDYSANPYLAFAAILMAGIDGIKNKLEPTFPIDIKSKSMLRATQDEKKLNNQCARVPCLGSSLKSLDENSDFLCINRVFNRDLIKWYVEQKQKEWNELTSSINPLEFKYSYTC